MCAAPQYTGLNMTEILASSIYIHIHYIPYAFSHMSLSIKIDDTTTPRPYVEKFINSKFDQSKH